MVIEGGRSGEGREDSRTTEKNSMTAMGTERSRSSLRNFSLPCFKWGEQRQLRCVKVDNDGANGGRVGGGYFPALNRRSPPTSSKPYRDSGGVFRKPLEPNRKRISSFEPQIFQRSSSQSQPELRRRPPNADDDGPIEAFGKKMILDFQTQVERMRFAVSGEGSEEIEPPPTAAEARPWNLRTRRALCKEPNATGGSGGKIQTVYERKPNISPPRASVKSPARRSDVDGGVGGEKRRKKLRVPLTKQDIEEDFIAMTGTRPPRKPKKRPRNVQKQIDRLFPGFWLLEVKAWMYEVKENAEVGKR